VSECTHDWGTYTVASEEGARCIGCGERVLLAPMRPSASAYPRPVSVQESARSFLRRGRPNLRLIQGGRVEP
jgi:hypothetical protein